MIFFRISHYMILNALKKCTNALPQKSCYYGFIIGQTNGEAFNRMCGDLFRQPCLECQSSRQKLCNKRTAFKKGVPTPSRVHENKSMVLNFIPIFLSPTMCQVLNEKQAKQKTPKLCNFEQKLTIK